MSYDRIVLLCGCVNILSRNLSVRRIPLFVEFIIVKIRNIGILTEAPSKPTTRPFTAFTFLALVGACVMVCFRFADFTEFCFSQKMVLLFFPTFDHSFVALCMEIRKSVKLFIYLLWSFRLVRWYAWIIDRIAKSRNLTILWQTFHFRHFPAAVFIDPFLQLYPMDPVIWSDHTSEIVCFI